MAHGNDWARSFMRGMGMRHDGWAELVNDEERGGCLIPMMMHCHEHDENPNIGPINGRPGWNRTSNPQLRRLMLYPIELRAHAATPMSGCAGRGIAASIIAN